MKNDPEAVRVRRVKALRIGIATLTEILSEIEPNAELAARPAPVADASLEARAQAALAAFNACPVWRDNSLTGNEQEQRAMVDVVRAVDASRPGLTEKAARAIVRPLMREVLVPARAAGIEVPIVFDERPLVQLLMSLSRGDVPPEVRDREGLADVVAASAREPHADVVLHALHVSGGAAAVNAMRAKLHDGDPAHFVVTARIDGETRTTVDGGAESAQLVPIAQAVGKLQETIADAVMLSVEIDHLVRAAGGPWALHADKPKAEADVNAIDRLANIGRTASFAPDGGVDPWEEIDEDTREEWRVIARAIAADISNSVRSDLDRARQQLADLVPADGPLDALKAANAIDELLANVTRKLLPLAT